MSKIKTITRKTTPATFDESIQKLKELNMGWLGNFRMASIQGKLHELDGWSDADGYSGVRGAPRQYLLAGRLLDYQQGFVFYVVNWFSGLYEIFKLSRCV